MNLLHRKQHIIFLFSLFSVISILITSCTTMGPTPGGGPTTVTRTVTVQNPQWAVGVGWGATWDSNNYVDIKLRISVKTLNTSGSLVPWGSTFYKMYVQDFAHSDAYLTNDIAVPETGNFVIEVTTEGKECTWINANTSNCSYPNNHSTYQYYADQHTFTDLNNGNYYFYNLPKDYDDCCQ